MRADSVNKSDDLSILELRIIIIPDILDDPDQGDMVVLHIFFEQFIIERPVRL